MGIMEHFFMPTAVLLSDAEQLSEIAVCSAATFKQLDRLAKVAMLSYSSYGSAGG